MNDVDLGYDEIVTELEQLAGESPDLVALAGFLGPAHGEDSETRVRLYADATLFRWVEIERSAIRRRERVTHEDDTLAPTSVVWVDAEALRQQFDGVPEKLELEFLNDRAELGIEPPQNMLEVVGFMKMSAAYASYGPMTRRTRRPCWHC